MAEDPGRLSPADYDPWRLASPLQLLHLIQRLGVTGRVIARWLGVKPAAISMWSRAKRPIPLAYGQPLLVWAQDALAKAAALNQKEVAAQPTEALQQAVQSHFTTLWTTWKLQVLYDAGTLHTGLVQQYEALGRVVRQAHFTPADRETMALMQESILAKVDVLVTLQGAVPSADEQWDARLTAAHAAVHPTQPHPAAEDQT